MNKSEYIELVENTEIKIERVKVIEKTYQAQIPDMLSKVISVADSVDFFDEERRALSYTEIFNPQKKIGVDFVGKSLIPVIDAYDCTYIVYSLKEKKWAKYNTVDEVLFKKKDSLKDVL